jgi:hypothetical protein
MEYQVKGHFDRLTWLLLSALMWTGVAGIAWNLLKPGGWLSWTIDQILDNQPTGFYYLAVGVLGVIAVKVWLDTIYPQAFRNLLTVMCAFAGTFFILALLLQL